MPTPCMCIHHADGCLWDDDTYECVKRQEGDSRTTPCMLCSRQAFCPALKIDKVAPSVFAYLGDEGIGWFVNITFDRPIAFGPMMSRLSGAVHFKCQSDEEAGRDPPLQVQYNFQESMLAIVRRTLYINTREVANAQLRLCELTIIAGSIVDLDFVRFQGTVPRTFMYQLGDTVAPVIESFTPRNNAVNLPLDINVYVQFSERIFPGASAYHEPITLVELGVVELGEGGNSSEDRIIKRMSLLDPEVSLNRNHIMVSLTGLRRYARYSLSMEPSIVADAKNNSFRGLPIASYVLRTTQLPLGSSTISVQRPFAGAVFLILGSVCICCMCGLALSRICSREKGSICQDERVSSKDECVAVGEPQDNDEIRADVQVNDEPAEREVDEHMHHMGVDDFIEIWHEMKSDIKHLWTEMKDLHEATKEDAPKGAVLKLTYQPELDDAYYATLQPQLVLKDDEETCEPDMSLVLSRPSSAAGSRPMSAQSQRPRSATQRPGSACSKALGSERSSSKPSYRPVVEVGVHHYFALPPPPATPPPGSVRVEPMPNPPPGLPPAMAPHLHGPRCSCATCASQRVMAITDWEEVSNVEIVEDGTNPDEWPDAFRVPPQQLLPPPPPPPLAPPPVRCHDRPSSATASKGKIRSLHESLLTGRPRSAPSHRMHDLQKLHRRLQNSAGEGMHRHVSVSSRPQSAGAFRTVFGPKRNSLPELTLKQRPHSALAGAQEPLAITLGGQEARHEETTDQQSAKLQSLENTLPSSYAGPESTTLVQAQQPEHCRQPHSEFRPQQNLHQVVKPESEHQLLAHIQEGESQRGHRGPDVWHASEGAVQRLVKLQRPQSAAVARSAGAGGEKLSRAHRPQSAVHQKHRNAESQGARRRLHHEMSSVASTGDQHQSGVRTGQDEANNALRGRHIRHAVEAAEETWNKRLERPQSAVLVRGAGAGNQALIHSQRPQSASASVRRTRFVQEHNRPRPDEQARKHLNQSQVHDTRNSTVLLDSTHEENTKRAETPGSTRQSWVNPAESEVQPTLRIIRDHRPRTSIVHKGGARPGVAPEEPTACQQDKRLVDLDMQAQKSDEDKSQKPFTRRSVFDVFDACSQPALEQPMGRPWAWQEGSCSSQLDQHTSTVDLPRRNKIRKTKIFWL
eukprot:TRINITY_DN31931_c0_g1_i1.p1 TRINITY_DN31931_c0_g1~~TRINITY_DN31931_c0_g1_i1.p1  ORF type:complete len:1199 (-),score=136.54 TRINITY_DN31931_c0_g1_i1:194-3613(-)